MDLSVVIVNWNSGAHLSRLLESLVPLAEELDGVWVIDNASGDNSLQDCPSYGWLRLMALDENQGFGGAANRGIQQIRTRFVLLLNPDIVLIPDSVRKLYAEMEQSPSAAIVCGSLRDIEGREQRDFQIRPLPTWRSVLSDALFIDEMRSWLRAGKRTGVAGEGRDGSRQGRAEKLVGRQPAAAAWLLRKEAWQELNGFDTRFHPAWFEDVDFCRRLQGSGWEILYRSDSPLLHTGGHTLDQLGYRAFVSVFYRNLLRYLRKHHPFSYPLLWLPVRLGAWVRRLLVHR